MFIYQLPKQTFLTSPMRDNGEEERGRKHVKDPEDGTNRDNENYENEN